ETSLKMVLVKVVLAIALVYSIGFFLNREDPLFVKSKYSIALSLLPITVLSLYYGFVAGVAYLTLFVALKFFIYGKVEGLYVLYNFLFLLIFSEFHFYWNKVVQQSEERVEYISERLRSLARSLSVLKFSHDRLENYHISKPISIRGFLKDMKNDILKGIDLKEALERMCALVSNMYAVEKAGLYEYERGSFRKIVSVGGMGELDTRDPLVQHGLEQEEIAYVPVSAVKSGSKYLCFIPIYVEGGLRYAFVIEKIPFMNLNADSVLSMSMLFYYIVLEYYDLESVKGFYQKFPRMDLDMIKEINRCVMLKRRYDLDSTVVVFKLGTWDESLYYLLSENVRGLDYVAVYKDRLILVLLPFTNPEGAYRFLKRVEGLIKDFKGLGFSQLKIYHQTYRVEDTEKLLWEVEKLSADEPEHGMVETGAQAAGV
ncbi:MAG: PelD GGDEF domain-containing protein, partial [Aquificaceae bacterium]|nr:PelD GGDEF domain-containing protein [Aquificaceae bacterium]